MNQESIFVWKQLLFYRRLLILFLGLPVFFIQVSAEKADTLLLVKRSVQQLHQEKYDEAILLCDSALNLPGISSFDKTSIYSQLGKIYGKQSLWQKAEINYLHALRLVDSLHIEEKERESIRSGLMIDLAKLHIIYSAQYNLSVEFIVNALRIGETHHDTALMIKANYLLGSVNRQLNDYKSSEVYLNQSLALARRIGDTLALIYAYNELANLSIYNDQNYDKAMPLFDEALSLAKQSNATYGIAFISNDIGNMYFMQNDFKRALPYMQYSLELHKQLGMYRELCIVTLNIASCYIEINQFDSAKYYLISGLEMAEKYNIRNEKLQLYQAMGILMSKTGNFKSAFEYQQSYIALYDSIYNSEKDKMVADITGKYEIEQKEKENELLRQQNTIKQLQVEKTTNKLKYLFLIALVIILSITVFLWMLIRSNKARKETNKILEGKNRQIVLQKDQLVETLHFLSQREHNLAEANATKDRFFSIIAHDLKNPFTGILGFSKILNDDFDQLSEAEQRQYISYINESSDQLYKLLDNLLQWARAQLNQIDPKPEQIAIGRLVNNCVLLYKNIARNKNIHIEYDPRCNLTAYADPGMMETIMRNLLSNAIKFSPHDGVIKISASKVGKHTEITVSDSGIGMSDEEQLKLFKIDVRLQKKGTASEQGSGLGLIICKEFVERNHGSVRLQSKKGVGSQFTITLPEG